MLVLLGFVLGRNENMVRINNRDHRIKVFQWRNHATVSGWFAGTIFSIPFQESISASLRLHMVVFRHVTNPTGS